MRRLGDVLAEILGSIAGLQWLYYCRVPVADRRISRSCRRDTIPTLDSLGVAKDESFRLLLSTLLLPRMGFR